MVAHTVKSYEDELAHLSSLIAVIGGHCESQLTMAMDAVVQRDTSLADRVIEKDREINRLDREISHQAMRLLALRQPMGVDLREIVTAIKISTDLERIGDLAKNIAKRVHAVMPFEGVRAIHGLSRMNHLALIQLKDALDAYTDRNASRASDIHRRDSEIDELYISLFRELLTYMMEDPRNITLCTHLLFIAKNIERVGDHVTNIVEGLYYLVHGKPWSGGDIVNPQTSTSPSL